MEAMILDNETAHPEIEGWAVNDGRSPIGHATDPPPRVFAVARRRGLLASGLHSPSRFPSGVLSGGLTREGRVPVTVAGPRRTCTGFRVAPFVIACTAGLVYWFTPAAAREADAEG